MLSIRRISAIDVALSIELRLSRAVTVREWINPTGLVPWTVRFSHYPIAGYLPPSARPDKWSGRAEGEAVARRRRVAERLTIHGTSPWDYNRTPKLTGGTS